MAASRANCVGVLVLLALGFSQGQRTSNVDSAQNAAGLAHEMRAAAEQSVQEANAALSAAQNERNAADSIRPGGKESAKALAQAADKANDALGAVRDAEGDAQNAHAAAREAEAAAREANNKDYDQGLGSMFGYFIILGLLGVIGSLIFATTFGGGSAQSFPEQPNYGTLPQTAH